MTKIESGAFGSCGLLEKIAIPKSVISINESSFVGSNKLKTVYYGGSETEWNNIIDVHLSEELSNANIIYNSNGYLVSETKEYATLTETTGKYKFVVNNINHIETENKDYYVYGVAYNENGLVVEAKKVKPNEKGVVEFSLKKSDELTNGKIKIYVWTDMMLPVAKPVEFEI